MPNVKARGSTTTGNGNFATAHRPAAQQTRPSTTDTVHHAQHATTKSPSTMFASRDTPWHQPTIPSKLKTKAGRSTLTSDFNFATALKPAARDSSPYTTSSAVQNIQHATSKSPSTTRESAKQSKATPFLTVKPRSPTTTSTVQRATSSGSTSASSSATSTATSNSTVRYQHLSTWSHLTVEGDVGTLRDVSTRGPNEGRERWCRVERRGDQPAEDVLRGEARAEDGGKGVGKSEDEDWIFV